MYQCARKTGKNSAWRNRLIIVAFLVAATLLYPSLTSAKTSPGTSAMGGQGDIAWGWVSVKGAYVRKGPGTRNSPLGIIGKGRLVVVLKKNGNWVEVQYELGKKGWIFSKNLTDGLPSKLAPADRILLVKDRVTGDKGVIEIYFNGRISNEINTFGMGHPSRLVMDVKGLKSPRNKSYALGSSSLLSTVILGVHPGKTRYVLYLKGKVKKTTHSVSNEKNAVLLSLLLGTPPKNHTTSAKPAVASKSRKKNRVIRVTKTGFKDETSRSIIMLNVTSAPTYYVRVLKGKMGLILGNTQIDKRYLRFFDTSGFPTPIKKVEFKNIIDIREGKKAEIWVTISEMIPYDVKVSSGTLKWIFKKPKRFIAMAEAGKKTVLQETNTPKSPAASPPTKPHPAPKAIVASNASQPSPTNSGPSEPPLLEKPRYTGAKMSFDFQNADIHNVLRLIAEVSNLNIVAGDDVRGKITLRLKNVPWDQALDIILQSKGLGKQQIGNVLRIAPMAKLKKEIQEKISTKKVKEKLEPRITEYIPVNYTTAKDLSVKIKPMLSPRGTITVDERTNTLIVKDVPKKVTDVKDMVSRLDTPTPEVLIESRIVEASKEFTREVGIKWGANYNAGPQYGNAPSPNFPNAMNVRGGATGQAGGGTTGGTTAGGVPLTTVPMVNLPATAAYGALGITLEQVVDIFTLDVELTAMEDNGLGKVISSPRIATLDNKTARIEQGLRIPYLKITEEGTVTTEFIEANLNMEVTPHVSNDKMINMEITVRKDTPDWAHLVQGVPSIDKKEATTNVMVKDGGVTAIGGIFTIEKTNTIHKVPLFGDIPILGWAFKNKRTVKNRKELLIFISPKLIPLKNNRK